MTIRFSEIHGHRWEGIGFSAMSGKVVLPLMGAK